MYCTLELLLKVCPMKKCTLLAVLLIAVLCANAQQRYILYEEFTGEDCKPCAAQNPILWSLLQSGSNPSKILLLKYMAPYYGPFSHQYDSAIHRYHYYSVSFWPNTRMDGKPQNPADTNAVYPMFLNQSIIDSRYAVASAFNLSVSYSWSPAYDSIIAVINISAVSNFAPTGANLRLRTALVQPVEFDNPPGINGEKHFENVVREMYPNTMGTAIANSWTAGTTQTITIKGPVPKYVNKADSPFMAVWIQNDNDKRIEQAARSVVEPLPVDAGLKIPQYLYCNAGSSVGPKVSLMNTGSTTLISANLHYSVDGGAMTNQPWTGSLAPGDTTLVALPPMTVGTHVLYDSVSAPNATGDINIINNANKVSVYIRSTTPVSIPMSSDLESGLPNNWTFIDHNHNGKNWKMATVPNRNGAGTNAAVHGGYQRDIREENYLVVAPSTLSSPKKLYFWVAYGNTGSDSLDIVYSTDCGNTWTTIFSFDHDNLQTTSSIHYGFSPYIPATTEWKLFYTDVSMVPTGAMLAIRAVCTTCMNNLYIDNIGLTDQPIVSGSTVPAIQNNIRIYPVPATDMLNVSFPLTRTSEVRTQLYDQTGRIVHDYNHGYMDKADNLLHIATHGIPPGVYTIMLKTSDAVYTKAVTILK